MTSASVEEFRSLWEREFGEKLSASDAALHAKRLVALYECLLAEMEKGARESAAERHDGQRD
jgi:hypothetical protein